MLNSCITLALAKSDAFVGGDHVAIPHELDFRVGIGLVVDAEIVEVLRAKTKAQLRLTAGRVDDAAVAHVDRARRIHRVEPCIAAGRLDATVAVRTKLGIARAGPTVRCVEIGRSEHEVTRRVEVLLSLGVAVEVLVKRLSPACGSQTGAVTST